MPKTPFFNSKEFCGIRLNTLCMFKCFFDDKPFYIIHISV
ncbi:hypothetical protein NY78_4406 [Desulfovibrio sp. TomC]|nr:hypothetical protein NY78_4406 [Desulfovibrio sp. TomC]